MAEKVGVDRVHIFSLGPVFSAFGSSVSDISHVYERALPGLAITDDAVTRVQQLVEEMKAEAVKDMLGEGVADCGMRNAECGFFVRPDDVTYTTEIEASLNGENSVPVPCSESSFRNANELQAVLSSALVNCGVKDKQSAIRDPPSAIELALIRVRAKKAMPKPKLVERPLQGENCSHARIGTRQVFWGSLSGEAQIYRWESLQPGNRVEGCAVLEGVNTTTFIPDGWVMVVDGFGNGALSRRSKEGQ